MFSPKKKFLPVKVIFNPNWWHKNAGISFDRSFYSGTQTRIQNDIIMRKVLYPRYGQMRLGEPDPQPRPVIGSLHMAGGFVIPALSGVEILFAADAAPQPVAACRQALQHAFFNLRLGPVRMLSCTPQEIASDTESLLCAAGPLELAGICCINMDYGTPGDNLFAMYQVVEKYHQRG